MRGSRRQQRPRVALEPLEQLEVQRERVLGDLGRGRTGRRARAASRASSTSASTATGWWKAPTRFLPSGRFTAVLPPIAASTCAVSVVGTCTNGDAAHVRGRDEPGEVADRAAAERHDRRRRGGPPASRAGGSSAVIVGSDLASSPSGTPRCTHDQAAAGEPALERARGSARRRGASATTNARSAPGSSGTMRAGVARARPTRRHVVVATGDRDPHALQRSSSSLDRRGDLARWVRSRRRRAPRTPGTAARARGTAARGRPPRGSAAARTPGRTRAREHLERHREEHDLAGRPQRDRGWPARARRRHRTRRPRGRAPRPRSSAAASSSRNRASPSRSKISRTVRPAVALDLARRARRTAPRAGAASSGPTVDLPEPGIPTR